MHYSVQYEVCALGFLIIVACQFFKVRQFPDKLNRLFGVILGITVIDLLLDIVSSITIEYGSPVPYALNYIIISAFYALRMALPSLVMAYVLILTDQPVYIAGSFKIPKRLFAVFVPTVIFELLLLTNRFTGAFFLLEHTGGVFILSHQWLYVVIYFLAMLYLIGTGAIAIRFRNRLKKNQYHVIMGSILTVITAMLLQYFVFPDVLIIGVAMVASITLMYFSLQNPESMLDQTSGVFNHSAMMAYLQSAIAEDRDMWLIAINVDGINVVNAAGGVGAGNDIIAQVGAFLAGRAKGKAVAFRMISARFLLILDNEADYRDSIQTIERRFIRPWTTNRMDFSLTCTICHFCEQDFFATPEDIINLIDWTYYQMGTDGLGSTMLVDAALMKKLRRRLEVEGIVRDALSDEKGFTLYFQPIYSVKEGCFTCAEVLLRLHTDRLNILYPSEFIPIAENTGLIYQIDRLVISKTCEFIRSHPELRDLGIRYLELNLSAVEFYRDVDELCECIEKQHGSHPEMLCFEVTETSAATYQNVLADFMKKMINQGCSFALDDFGSGYANIAQIVNLPFSIVKLNRAQFTSGGDKARHVFTDLLGMFRNLGLTTVVECVETLEQVEQVAALGADQIQGYYFSRPVPEDEFLALLNAKKCLKAK